MGRIMAVDEDDRVRTHLVGRARIIERYRHAPSRAGIRLEGYDERPASEPSPLLNLDDPAGVPDAGSFEVARAREDDVGGHGQSDKTRDACKQQSAASSPVRSQGRVSVELVFHSVPHRAARGFLGWKGHTPSSHGLRPQKRPKDHEDVTGPTYGRTMRVIQMDGPGGGWRVLVPETRWERMRGLRGHPPPGPREAMLFRRCRAVQTFGMREPISVVFLDRSWRVVRVRRGRSGRVVLGGRHARHVLETGTGSGLRFGDRFSPALGAAR